jgi:phenylpropionate dioxygenase-like ring-hydroxylating dioxygenase large terminal subunit
MYASSLGEQKKVQQILGEKILFLRDSAKVRAVQAFCPHRGAPLRLGTCIAPGVLSCAYHGMTFDLGSGACVAALTEGPDSSTVGRLALRSYPIEERFGIVWIFMGNGAPPPLAEDLPEDMLDDDAVVLGRFSIWKAHWRVTIDNGPDASHVPIVHRKHRLVRSNLMPSFFKVNTRRDGKWLRISLGDIGYQADYPRVGTWPTDNRFRKPATPVQTSVRLPGIIRIVFPGRFTHLRWATPIDEHRTLTFQCLVRRTSGLGALAFRLYYHLYQKWNYHVSFQRDDEVVMEEIERLVPEHLTASDAPVVQWRRMEREARGAFTEAR